MEFEIKDISELQDLKAKYKKSIINSSRIHFICEKCGTSTFKLGVNLKNLICKKCIYKENFKAKYGETNPSKLKQVKDLKKESYKIHYGVDNPLKSKTILDKVLNTKETKYGTKTYNNREKAKETCNIKYNVDNVSQLYNIKNKKIVTCLNNYNVDNPSKSEEIKYKKEQSCIKHFGVKYTLQSELLKNKYKETMVNKYGVEHPSQNHDIFLKQFKKIKKYGITFGSRWELILYDYLKNNNIDFEYQPNISFEFNYAGKTHKYYPDFLINDEYYEVKGDHFFKDGKMICPFHKKDDTPETIEWRNGLFEAKHQCMIRYGVKILKGLEISKLEQDFPTITTTINI